MSKTVVILGAGLAGLPLAHYVLKHYAEKYDLKLLLVSPSDESYWNIAAPRAALPGQCPDDKVFYSISSAFAKYSTHRFEFILGSAETWNPDNNSVTVSLNSILRKRIIDYHTLVVATGSDYSDGMPWKLVGTSQETHNGLEKLRKEVEKAKSIVVGGAGPTGVEFAGELGYEYAKAGKKRVTLIMSDKLPLESRVMDATRLAAMKELEKLNVNIISNTRVTKVSNNAGEAILELTKSDGTKQTLKTDLFTPTWGIKYNTSFAPASLREADGRLKVTKSLRAPGYENVFLVGDAANVDSYAAGVREAQVRYLANALGQHFAGIDLTDFVPLGKLALTVAVGRGRGVGEINGWNAWSFFIWYFKGRNMCTDIVPDYVAGKRLVLGSFK